MSHYLVWCIVSLRSSIPYLQEITPASIRSARLKSLAGIAPIDLSGPITLKDEKHPERVIEQQGQKKKEKTLKPGKSRWGPNESGSQAKEKSWAQDDLTKPPTMPASSTHRMMDRKEGVTYDALADKTPFKSHKPRKEASSNSAPTKDDAPKGRWSAEKPTATDPDAPLPDADFGTLKRALPKLGWADVKRAQASQQTDATTAAEPISASQNASWTDEQFLTLFPHMRKVRTTSADSVDHPDTSSSPTTAAAATFTDATPEQLQAVLQEVRTKSPELEKLHYTTTWLKVKKWRELLGATRGEESLSASSNDPVASTPMLPENYPSNALHPRFYQPDIFLSSEDVGAILMKEKGLLYASIENVIVPRFKVLRTLLPGVNLGKIIMKYPGLFLLDLSVMLPLKLRELSSLFPEINLVALLEQQPTLLTHDVSSFIIPRLNLFQELTQYDPKHILQFLFTEYPSLIERRWNRLKRMEIVKEEQFWPWWRKQSGQVADNDAVAESTSSDVVVSQPLPSPSTLPFSLYADLILMSQETFQANFPWFELKFTPAEKLLLERQKGSKKKVVESASGSKSSTTSSPAVSNPLSTLTPAILAKVPGHPQPIATALGLTEESTLTQDEQRARKRMEYLKLKAAKAEKRDSERAFMREKQADHQRQKMQEYTNKFQSVRARGGLTVPRVEEDKSASSPPSSSARWSGGSSFNRGSRDGLTHQKNRAGHAAVSRHASHSQGRVEPPPTGAVQPSSPSVASSSFVRGDRHGRTEERAFGSSFVSSLNQHARTDERSRSTAPGSTRSASSDRNNRDSRDNIRDRSTGPRSFQHRDNQGEKRKQSASGSSRW